MARASTWTNNDGLVVGFGKHTVDNEVAAVSEDSAFRTQTLLVDLTTLGATVTAADIDQRAARIPRGSAIRSATIQMVEAATSGGAATLDVGLYSPAGVADSATGLDAAVALTAIDVVGETVIGNGALVAGTVPAGATSNTDVVVACNYNAAAYTAGKALITVEYLPPSIAAIPA